MEFDNPGDCERFIKERYDSEPERMRRLLVVADRVRQSARDINELNPGTNLDENLAFCAALLLELGELEEVKEASFPPVDSYNYLIDHGHRRLGEILLAIGVAPEEAQVRGIDVDDVPDNLITSLVTYWDFHTSDRGEIIEYTIRRSEILTAASDHDLVAEAHERASLRLKESFERIKRLLHESPI